MKNLALFIVLAAISTIAVADYVSTEEIITPSTEVTGEISPNEPGYLYEPGYEEEIVDPYYGYRSSRYYGPYYGRYPLGYRAEGVARGVATATEGAAEGAREIVESIIP